MRSLPIALGLTLLAASVLPLSGADFPWQRDYAKVSPDGDIELAQEPFTFVAGSSVRYIDYEAGDDANDGSKAEPWKHHPWDAAATGRAAACDGVHTYVFKGGVIYRGALTVDDAGTAEEPIRLTRDPEWGTGPAVIAGSEVVTGLQPGKAHPKIAAPDRVLSADLEFAPRCVWLVSTEDGSVKRLPLARTPNWTVSNWDDIKSEWWEFDMKGVKHQDNTMKINGRDYNSGIDSKHKADSAADYEGAYIWSEWGYVMGTPYPTRVIGYNPKRGQFGYHSVWGGTKGEKVIRRNRYYLEDKPNFLDDPEGEFWFDKQGGGGTLHVILPDGTDPGDWRIEAARRPTLIDATEMNHVHISGLDFMFTNVRWDLDANPHRLDRKQGKWLPRLESTPACIRLTGSGKDIRVTNCRFRHFNSAVRLRAEHDDNYIDQIVVADNDLAYGDHDALQFLSGDYWGTNHRDRVGYIGDLSVLRNKLAYTGQRPTRYGQGHAINITYPRLLHVAGNVLDRCYAAGIFVYGGKTAQTERPLTRLIIHQNKVTNCLLNSNDWGQIEHWIGGPAYIFNNVSGNPGGYWHYNFDAPWAKEHANARFGHAYYSDHGKKGYFFNNIAWGNENALRSPLTNCSAFQEIANRQNTFFNNTAHKFLVGQRRQGPKKGLGKYLGNIYDQISLRVLRHSDPKGAPSEANAHHVGPLDKEFDYETNAYAKNLATPTFKEFGVFELVGQRHQTLESFAAANEEAQALASSVGEIVDEVLPNAEEHDFTPAAVADGKGAVTFVPWGLARNAAEWNFYRERKRGRVLDEHWANHPSGGWRFHLEEHNIEAGDYVEGPLENWVAGAVRLDGDDAYYSVAHDVVDRSHTVKRRNRWNKQDLPPIEIAGDKLWSPAVNTANLLIEVYLSVEQGGVIIEKMGEEAGYSLSVDDAGKAVFTLASAGERASVVSDTAIADGDWHHVLVEADRAANTLTVYVDGRRDAQDKGIGTGSLANPNDVYVGGTPYGRCLTGTIDMMRMALGTLAEAETTIEELHAWQFDGPQWRDFSGREPSGAGRDAGAIEGR